MRLALPAPMVPAARDLFGQVPVTWPELWAWLEAVPGIARGSWRAPYYIEYWNVAEKIRAAKLAGTFELILAGPKPLCHRCGHEVFP